MDLVYRHTVSFVALSPLERRVAETLRPTIVLHIGRQRSAWLCVSDLDGFLGSAFPPPPTLAAQRASGKAPVEMLHTDPSRDLDSVPDGWPDSDSEEGSLSMLSGQRAPSATCSAGAIEVVGGPCHQHGMPVVGGEVGERPRPPGMLPEGWTSPEDECEGEQRSFVELPLGAVVPAKRPRGRPRGTFGAPELRRKLRDV